jgi:hypothetical protein
MIMKKQRVGQMWLFILWQERDATIKVVPVALAPYY